MQMLLKRLGVLSVIGMVLFVSVPRCSGDHNQQMPSSQTSSARDAGESSTVADEVATKLKMLKSLPLGAGNAQYTGIVAFGEDQLVFITNDGIWHCSDPSSRWRNERLYEDNHDALGTLRTTTGLEHWPYVDEPRSNRIMWSRSKGSKTTDLIELTGGVTHLPHTKPGEELQYRFKFNSSSSDVTIDLVTSEIHRRDKSSALKPKESSGRIADCLGGPPDWVGVNVAYDIDEENVIILCRYTEPRSVSLDEPYQTYYVTVLDVSAGVYYTDAVPLETYVGSPTIIGQDVDYYYLVNLWNLKQGAFRVAKVNGIRFMTPVGE